MSRISWKRLQASQDSATKHLDTFHGGPQLKTTGSPQEHPLPATYPVKHGPVLSIVKDGQVLLRKRYARALPQISTAITTLANRAGVPAQFPSSPASPGRQGADKDSPKP